jgi:GT2 family glycosyltransferase
MPDTLRCSACTSVQETDMHMQVSVIVAAHNAEDTIADTLESLVVQTFPHWEAIVVDDGSTDATSRVVSTFVERDNRFRLLRQENLGESGARNSGIKLARFDWLLFLDSDDWILPRHLEQLTGILKNDPGLDVAYCGWTYVTPDGQYVFESFGEETGDLFAEHAEYCFSVVHTYLVRRSLVEEASGFDLSLCTCADWDLWQRIARTGARFGAVPETLAVYRIRAGSATRDGVQLLTDGLRVLDQGHAQDLRVLKPLPLHANGYRRKQLPRRKLELACTCAGYLIGGGKDALPLLDLLQGEYCPNLDAYSVANCLFRHALVSSSRPLSEWSTVWHNFAKPIDDFLLALEAASGSRELARRVRPLLKYLLDSVTTGHGVAGHVRSAQARAVLRVHQNASRYLQQIRQLMMRLARVPHRTAHALLGGRRPK